MRGVFLGRKLSSILCMLNLKCLFDIYVEKSKADIERNKQIFVSIFSISICGVPWKGLNRNRNHESQHHTDSI